MSVTPQYLLQGAAYALEQCGLLLRDANALYRNGSYANAVVLAAFAREELGRSGILFDLRRRVLAGEAITIVQIRQACEDHVAKQKAGMLSTTLTADRDTGLGKLMRTKMENPPQSPEWQKADAELQRIDEIKKKRTPSDRHEERMAALYVEPASDSQWNRPTDISASEAHDFLQVRVGTKHGAQRGRANSGLGVITRSAAPCRTAAVRVRSWIKVKNPASPALRIVEEGMW
jgi:AbiV family abortive infection protein